MLKTVERLPEIQLCGSLVIPFQDSDQEETHRSTCFQLGLSHASLMDEKYPDRKKSETLSSIK